MEREGVMEREEATSSRGLYGGGGVGGKFRKPPSRKPPTTPYERPPQTQNRQRSDGGGWLSKLVDPATRLISGGATRFLPSFFSKTLFGSDSDQTDATQDDSDENLEYKSNIQISRSVIGGQCPAETDRSESGSDISERVGEQLGNSSGNSFSEIEQMLKEKTFSRHDLNRLTELLHSRIADRTEVDEGLTENPNITTRAEGTGGSLAQEHLRTSVEEKQAGYLDRVTGAVSTPPQLTIRNQVGASPIDIAKAYMGARISEIGPGSQCATPTDERTPLPTDGFSSKPSTILSPTSKPSICWPGAMVQDQRAYQTPQTERHRIGLHNVPRTPYSRPVHSRSTSKLQDSGDRSINISSNQLKQSYTPNIGYSQVTRTRSPEDRFGSVGPIHRIRHKFDEATPLRGANSFHLAKSSPNGIENFDASKGFLLNNKQNLEPGPSRSSKINFQTLDSKPPSSKAGVSTVHPQSTEMARRILEHLDRTIPTPQKKSAELKLATSWGKSSSEFTTGMPNGQLNEAHIEGFDSHRSRLTTPQPSAKGKEVAGSSLFKAQPEQRNTDETSDSGKANASASNTVSSMNGFGSDMVGFNARPSTNFKKTQDSQVTAHKVTGEQSDYVQIVKNQPLPLHNHVDRTEASRLFLKDTVSEALNVQKKPPVHTFGSKPALTSISIAKPDPKHRVSFDNGSGFTFPVSTSSGTLTEPPTPSIMPFPSASGLPRSQEKPTVPTNNFGSNAHDPSYSFGSTKMTDGQLVFSFPSASSSTPSDGSSPKFKFGSDKSKRVSFRTAVDAADAGLKKATSLELTAQ